MSVREKIEQLKSVENYILVKRFGNNIHDLDLNETIETGVVDRLLNARELGIPYAVVVRGVASSKLNPLRGVITTFDIMTSDNNREQEKANIYAFLSGKKEEIKSITEYDPLLSHVGAIKR